MQNVIDANFGILPMENEIVLSSFHPNSKFVKYQTFKNAWHPFVIIAIPLIAFLAKYSFKNHRYWLTNKRLIASSGVIGFTVKSIPLEKIADVQLNKTWIHNILNTTSLTISDVSGNGNISIISIDNAPQIQLQILDAANKAKNLS